MRLLTYDEHGKLILTKAFSDSEIPPYAILSHTWGKDEEEIKLQEIENGPDKDKSGYRKIQLCGKQAARDGLKHFWVDTCCIDKMSSQDLEENINSMFRYYQRSTKCYVYLSDVRNKRGMREFSNSRWFKRGWTLQELLAPGTIEFFSREWQPIGSRAQLRETIHNITGIPLGALDNITLDHFSKEERMRWTIGRDTKRPEDKAYCLLGIFGVSMCLRYSEGEENALARLRAEIRENTKRKCYTAYSLCPACRVVTIRVLDAFS